MHDCIISLNGRVWAHITILTLPPFKCLYQHRNVYSGYWICLFLRLFYWVLEMFRRYGIFLLAFWNVPTVWYFLSFYWLFEMFRQYGIFCFSIGFLKCSDSVVFFRFSFYCHFDRNNFFNIFVGRCFITGL